MVHKPQSTLVRSLKFRYGNDAHMHNTAAFLCAVSMPMLTCLVLFGAVCLPAIERNERRPKRDFGSEQHSHPRLGLCRYVPAHTTETIYPVLMSVLLFVVLHQVSHESHRSMHVLLPWTWCWFLGMRAIYSILFCFLKVIESIKAAHRLISAHTFKFIPINMTQTRESTCCCFLVLRPHRHAIGYAPSSADSEVLAFSLPVMPSDDRLDTK